MLQVTGPYGPIKTRLMAIAIGVLLYAIITVRLNVLIMPGTELTAIRPSVVVPMLIGFLFGPLAGFFTGFFGNALGDSISFGRFFWPWDLGNGIMGALPGLSFLLLDKQERLGRKGQMYAPLLALVAAVIGMAVAVYLDLCFEITVDTSAAAWKVFVSSAMTDAINGAVLLPILLLIYAHLVHLVERSPHDQGTGPPE